MAGCSLPVAIRRALTGSVPGTPCFAQNDGSLTLQRHTRKHAHKGGSGAWTLRTCPPPVQHPNPDAQRRCGQRRVHFRRSPEAVHGPNPFCRRPIGGLGSQTRCVAFGVPFLRKESDSGPRLLDSGLRTCMKTVICRVAGVPPARGEAILASPFRGQDVRDTFSYTFSSAGARSLLVPGTCDLTHRRTDASASAAPRAWKGPNIPAP